MLSVHRRWWDYARGGDSPTAPHAVGSFLRGEHARKVVSPPQSRQQFCAAQQFAFYTEQSFRLIFVEGIL